MSSDGRNDKLAAHLRAGGRTAFVPGVADCSLWPADWVLQARGVDPGAAWRGRYRTDLGWMRQVRRAGGLEAVWRAALGGVGLVETTEPVAGDLGLVPAVTAWGVQPTGAICTGPRWAVLTRRGLLVAPAEPIAAWEV